MHRRSGLRCAHHFDPSRREARPLTRRHAVLQRRHCQQAASDDARHLTADLVMARPNARRHKRWHRDDRGWRRAPACDLLRWGQLWRQVTTATPFGARDGRKDKEPWESFKLTAAGIQCQEDAMCTLTIRRRLFVAMGCYRHQQRNDQAISSALKLTPPKAAKAGRPYLNVAS